MSVMRIVHIDQGDIVILIRTHVLCTAGFADPPIRSGGYQPPYSPVDTY